MLPMGGAWTRNGAKVRGKTLLCALCSSPSYVTPLESQPRVLVAVFDAGRVKPPPRTRPPPPSVRAWYGPLLLLLAPEPLTGAQHVGDGVGAVRRQVNFLSQVLHEEPPGGPRCEASASAGASSPTSATIVKCAERARDQGNGKPGGASDGRAATRCGAPRCFGAPS